jgi:hypothetical protein
MQGVHKHTNNTFPYVSYGCETGSMRLMYEYSLRTLKNSVLKRMISWTSREKEKEVTDWGELHDNQHRHFYLSQIIITVTISSMMRWAVHVASTGDIRNTCTIFVGKPEDKRPLDRPRRRWHHKIKMYL